MKNREREREREREGGREGRKEESEETNFFGAATTGAGVGSLFYFHLATTRRTTKLLKW